VCVCVCVCVCVRGCASTLSCVHAALLLSAGFALVHFRAQAMVCLRISLRVVALIRPQMIQVDALLAKMYTPSLMHPHLHLRTRAYTHAGIHSHTHRH